MGYNEDSETAFIPNEEIRQELITAVKSSNWNELIGFQEESRKLLMATLAMGAKRVAAQIEKIHHEYTSVIQYHNENSLSSVLTIAYLSAMQYYFKPIRELSGIDCRAEMESKCPDCFAANQGEELSSFDIGLHGRDSAGRYQL